MADKKISQLTSATLPLAGTELLPIVQSGTTDNITVNNLAAGNVKSNATTGVLQVIGPAAASTRVMTTPDANFTVARTDTGQTFTGTQTFSSDLVVNGIAVGKGANSVLTNTAVGLNALVSNTTGNLNAAFGRTALTANTTGVENTSCGANALQSNVDGYYNTAVGAYSLVLNSSGYSNTAIGRYSGFNLTTGTNCGFFGYNAQPSSATVSNEYTYGDVNVTAHRFTGGNLVIGTSGKGIDFSATPGTGTSELLADYEEGEWNPTVTSSVGAITSYTATGTYTKIGRLVTVFAVITITNVGTGSGGILVAGLPWAVTSSAIGTGRDVVASGYLVSASYFNSEKLYVANYNNTFPVTTNSKVVMSAQYYA